MRTKGVPASEIEEGAKLDWQFLRLTQRALLARALADHGVDTLGASAVRGALMHAIPSVCHWLLYGIVVGRCLCWFR